MDQLKSGGVVEYAWLGVGGQTLTPDVATAAGLTIEAGALIETVKSGSPAANAGTKSGTQHNDIGGKTYTVGGDVIVKADSTEIASFDDLIAFLATKKPGDTVTLTLVSKDGTRTVQATLMARPSPSF